MTSRIRDYIAETELLKINLLAKSKLSTKFCQNQSSQWMFLSYNGLFQLLVAMFLMHEEVGP